jgi:hypothetical protein
MHFCALVGIYDVHEQCGEHLHDKKLHHPLLTAIREVFSLFPVRQLVGLLAVVEGPKVVHFFLVSDHDGIDFFILHYILNKQVRTFYLS